MSTKQQNQSNQDMKKYFNQYFLLIFAIMPLVITPWRSDAFYDGKILFAGVMTIVYLLFAFRNTDKYTDKNIYKNTDKNTDMNTDKNTDKNTDMNTDKNTYKYTDKNTAKNTTSSQSSKTIKLIPYLIMLLMLFSLLSTIFSIDISLSIFGEQTCPEGLISLIINFAVFYIFYRDFVFSRRTLEWILIIASLIAVYGIINYFIRETEIERIFGLTLFGGLSTIGNRNFVGTYCTLFLPLAIGFYLKYWEKRSIIYIGIIFGLLMVSKTRSAWIALVISLFVSFVIILANVYLARIFANIKKFDGVRKIMLAIFAFLTMFAIVFASVNYIKNNDLLKRVKTIIYDAKNIEKDTTASHRVYFWKRTVPFMNDYPLLGSGPDTYGKQLLNNNVPRKLFYPKAHNEYLQMIVTLGYPYLIIYSLIVAIAMSRLLKKAIKSGDIFALCLFCCIFGYLIQAFFNFSVIATAPIYWGILGIGAGVREEA